MKKKQLIIPAVFCFTFMGGCTLTQNPNNQFAEPLYRVNGTADNPESLYQLGRYYQGQSRYEQAIAAYKRAVQADNKFSKARNGLGVVLSIQGKHDEAIQAFELAIREAPAEVYIYSNLGYAYYLKGLDAQAIDALKRAILHDPGNVRAHNNLALAYARMGIKQDPTNKLADTTGTQGRAAQSDNVPEDSRNGTVALAAHVQANTTMQEIFPARPNTEFIVDRIPNAIPVVRNRIEVLQSGLNIYELKERDEPLPIAERITQTEYATLASPANLVAPQIEVSNGNGVNGMAKALGELLRDKGFKVARLTNQKSFAWNVTQIEYRAGFLAEADRLRTSLHGEVNLVKAKNLRKDISVRLVLGKNLADNVSLSDAGPKKIHLAHAR